MTKIKMACHEFEGTETGEEYGTKKVTQDGFDGQTLNAIEGRVTQVMMGLIDKMALRTINANFTDPDGKPVTLNDAHLNLFRLGIAHRLFCATLDQAQSEDAVSHQFLNMANGAMGCINRNVAGLLIRTAMRVENGSAKLSKGTMLIPDVPDPFAGFVQAATVASEDEGGGGSVH